MLTALLGVAIAFKWISVQVVQLLRNRLPVLDLAAVARSGPSANQFPKQRRLL